MNVNLNRVRFVGVKTLYKQIQTSTSTGTELTSLDHVGEEDASVPYPQSPLL